MDAAQPVYCVGRAPLWYAAPDYVRLTIKRNPNEQSQYATYRYITKAVAEWAGEAESDEADWGFNGYVGRKRGPIAYGASYQGLILQAEGAAAERVFEMRPPWDNVSRLDVQVTYWYQEDREGLARELAEVVDRYRRGLHHRPFGLELRNGYGKGDTLYIGSRKSALFGRVYDKWRAPNGGEGYEKAWRFEVEYKEGYGCGPWADCPPNMSTPSYWLAIVLREFSRWGLVLPSDLQGTLSAETRDKKPRSTAAKRLRWLAGPVASSITKLRAAGIPMAEIAKALTGDLDPFILASGVLNQRTDTAESNDGTAAGQQENTVT